MKRFNVYIAIAGVIISHTFGYAQEPDSISTNQTGKILGIALPGAMITYGAISLGNNGIRKMDFSIRDHLIEKNALWNSGWDNYMQYSPAVAAFGMKLCGVESTHKTTDMAIIYALSNILSGGIVQGTKHIIKRERPDFSNQQSFPSGHTSTAFVAAEFLHQEYKNQSVWISIGGYSMASLIGVARVYKNKHWLSDVVTGAGTGILSTKTIYWVYPYLQNAMKKKNKPNNVFFSPSYHEGNWGIHFSYNF
jgi:membrane-associated phospholipid phosphatase